MVSETISIQAIRKGSTSGAEILESVLILTSRCPLTIQNSELFSCTFQVELSKANRGRVVSSRPNQVVFRHAPLRFLDLEIPGLEIPGLEIPG